MPYLGYTPPPTPVTTIDIQAGAIANTDLSVGAVTSHAIAASAVTTEKIAANAVTTEKIAATFKEQGLDTLWIPAAAMAPTVSYGCSNHTEVETTAGRPDMQVLDFDAGSTATANVNGTTSNSTALVVDGNSGTIVTGMVITGTGVTGTVTVTTVTDQNNLVLSSSQSLTNDVALTFTQQDEGAQFQISMPKSWNEGTITYAVYWTTTATDTDGVAWGLEGVAVSDNDTIDVAYGTAVVVTDDALGAAEDLMVSATSSALTIGGSPAAGDLCFFRVYRDHDDANDDMAEDARLIGVKMFFTTDAPTDA